MYLTLKSGYFFMPMSNGSCDRCEQNLDGSNVNHEVKLVLIFCKLCTVSTHNM